MKRTAALFFVLALLLTACTPAPSEEPAVTDPPAPSYSAQGTPTAGGVLVWTDPSAYRYSGSAAKYTRLREGPLVLFEPSCDYGAVYPYAAARLFTSGRNGDSSEVSARYGLVDASGRILTDGIYLNVEPLTAYSSEAMANVPLPYWLVSTAAVEEVQFESAPGETYTEVCPVTRYGVISMDGSFMLPVGYTHISVSNNAFVCYRDWSHSSMEVIDGAGRVLFTSEDLFGDEDIDYVMVWSSEEGLFLIETWDYDWNGQYWFCGNRGERVLGPYAEAAGFQDGLACVSLDREAYGYIDVTGAFVIEPKFRELSTFQNGRAIQSTTQSPVVIDTAGNVVFTAAPGLWDFKSEPCGYSGSDYEGGTIYYDPSGGVLAVLGRFSRCLDENTFCEGEYGGPARVFRLDGPELAIPELYSLKPGMTVLDGKAVKGYLGDEEREDGTRWYFVPEDLSAVLEIGDHGRPTPDTAETVYHTQDQHGGGKWYLTWNGTAWDAVNEAGEVRTIPLRADSLTLRGDRIMALTDRACVYVDWEGNVLFSYPLDSED